MLATKEPTQREITAAHHRLDVFISKRHTEGKSFGDGQTADDPRASGAPWTSDEHYEWLPGGSFLLRQWDALVGTRAFNGTKIIGHYEANGGSFTRFFDNASLHPEYSATIDGAVWNSSNHRHEPLSPFAKTATRSSTYGSGFKTATGYRSASEPRHADDHRTGTTSTHR